MVLKGKSPFKLLYEKLLTYSEFKFFGYICYIFNIVRHRNKVTPRSIHFTFLGYPTGYKGFKVYDLISKTFHVFRDIVFHEYTFPFHSISDNNYHIDPFHQLILPNPIYGHDPNNSKSDLTTIEDNLEHILLVPTSPCNVLIVPTISTLRGSYMTHRAPISLKDYVCHTMYPLTHSLSYDKLSSPYKNYVLNVTFVYEP